MSRPASVLGAQIASILAGAPVGPTLRDAIGERLAGRVQHVMARVVRIEGARSGRRVRRGVRASHQRTARVRFAAGPVRTCESRACRRIAALLLMVLEEMREDRKRVISRRLWIGQRCGNRSAGLAARLGVSAREVERYIVILRQGGILDQWQVPASELRERAPHLVARRSGYAYACWELVGDMPRELVERMRRWYSRRETRAPQVAPSVRVSMTGASSVRDALLAMVPGRLAES